MEKNKIIFNMASIPQRVESLREVVARIIPQCDSLNIYLNNYDKVPEFLNHEKIKVYRSQEEVGDLGDVGKFYCCSEWKNCFVFTVDDKILYPPDYAQRMIYYLEKYKKKIVVSCHGRIFPRDRKITSFYCDDIEYFACIYAQNKEKWIDELGTGVMAFHSSLIEPELNWFPTTNMSDIWLSIELQKRHIPVLAIPRPNKWLKISNLFDDGYSIHAYCKHNCQIQTDAVNSINWQTFKP